VRTIYEIHGGPDQLRWFWSFSFPRKPAPPAHQRSRRDLARGKIPQVSQRRYGAPLIMVISAVSARFISFRCPTLLSIRKIALWAV
jgi:hypothetical protein